MSTQPVLALDVDGVLIDTARAGRAGWQQVVGERFGVDPLRLQPFFRDQWEDVVCGRRPVEDALAEELARLRWDVGVEDLLACWFEADFDLDHSVADAVRGWVERGAAVVLATNQEHRRAAYLARRLAPLLPLAAIAHSALLGVAKPSHEYFLRADAHVRDVVDATHVVFVDDRAANVEAARGVGWHAIHFTPDGWLGPTEDALFPKPPKVSPGKGHG